MSNVAIQIEGLSKSYWLTRNAGVHSYRTLQEELLGALLPRRGPKPTRELFWALRDLSLTVQHGQVLGIVGRNGAGKSTLLKILSRITRPTAGSVDIYGRVGSLLEVGTGFHPELTGRENIFLNGAVLGMTRRDIQQRFEDIVAFAEVEQFLDTPVKRYSSGMYMRLAFSVAAHLEPEILLVDEVLAVGDANFQEKCLGKMSSVAREGRTVLFVSHSMATVQSLCGSGVVLDLGKLLFSGSIDEAIAVYTQNTRRVVEGTPLGERPDRKGSQDLRFVRVSFHDARDGREVDRLLSGQDIQLRFHYETQAALKGGAVNLAFNIYNPQGVLLSNLNTRDVGKMSLPLGRSGYFECNWPRFNLRSGVYSCALYCDVNGTVVDWIQSAFLLRVEDGDYFGTGSLISRLQGDVLVSYDFAAKVEQEHG